MIGLGMPLPCRHFVQKVNTEDNMWINNCGKKKRSKHNE